MPPGGPHPINALVDHLFRHRSGQMIAALTRIFGPANLTLAEDVVQEALAKALRLWPFRGIPDDPAGWLFTVARNAALDAIRRQSSRRRHDPEITILTEARLARDPAHLFESEMAEDQLRMMFMCCNLDIAPDARIALTLKTVGGFSVGEIADAFLSQASTIEQRITRAKRRIKDGSIAFEMPDPADLGERLDSVLGVLYLMFNEGYSAHRGDRLILPELCAEAVRLTETVADHPITGAPKSKALAALVLLQGARLPARANERGDVILLEDQNRGLWEQSWIARGIEYLEAAAEGTDASEYHLLAGIAACHSLSPDYEATDWPRIVGYYDALHARAPSPVVALNRAVALAIAESPQAGLDALEAIADEPTLKAYYLFPATRGELLRRSGQFDLAAVEFRRALSMAATDPAKRFLECKIAGLG